MKLTIKNDKFYRVFILGNITLWAIILLNWHRGWNFIEATDGWFKPNPEKQFHDTLYTWNAYRSMGFPNMIFPTLQHALYHYAIFTIFNLFLDEWKALVISEALILLMVFSIGSIYSYKFFVELHVYLYGNSFKHLRLSAFLLSLFYVFNLLTLELVFFRYTSWTLLWFCMPISCYFLMKALHKNTLKCAFIFAVIIALTPFSGITFLGVLPAIGITWFIFLLFLLLKNNNPRSIIKQYICRFILFVSTFLLVNAWSILPQILFIHALEVTSRVSSFSASADLKALVFASSFTSLINILLMRGYLILHTSKYSYAKYPYLWISFFFSPTCTILSISYPLLLFLSILHVSRKKDRAIKRSYMVLYLTMLLIILVMKGLQKPFPQLGYLLFKLHPVFFRHPHERFIFAYMFLYFIAILPIASDALNTIVCKFKFLRRVFFLVIRSLKNAHKIRKYVLHAICMNLLISMIVCMMILVSIFLAYPIFTGDVIHPIDRVNLEKSDYINTYQALNNLFSTLKNNDTDTTTILVLPFAVDTKEYTYNLSGSLHHPNAISLDYYLVENESIRILQYPFSPWENRFFRELYRYLITNRTREFANTLYVFNIKYILFHKDASDKLIIKRENREIISNSYKFIRRLENEEFVIKVFENKRLTLYKVNFSYERRFENFLSHKVYLASNTRVPLFLPAILDEISWIYSRDINSEVLNQMREHLPLLISGCINLEKENNISIVVNKTAKYDIIILVEKSNSLATSAINLMLNNVTYKVDYVLEKNGFAMYIIEDVFLTEGYHNFKVVGHDLQKFVYIIMLEDKEIYKQNSQNMKEYICIKGSQNQVIWRISLRVEKAPFLLIIPTTYDPFWKAIVYKDKEFIEECNSVPVYGILLGFLLNETGELRILIKYIPQDWFKTCLKISSLAIFGYILCLFYNWRLSCGDSWALIINHKLKKLLRRTKTIRTLKQDRFVILRK